MKMKVNIGASLASFSAAVTFGLFAQVGHAATELKLSHCQATNHLTHKELVRWAEELRQKSNGELTVKIFPSCQMGPLPRQFDLARTGVADITLGLHGATPGRFPVTELVHLPYMVSDSATGSNKLTALAPRYLATEHAGVRVLYLLVTQPLKFHMVKAQIGSLSDFNSLRVRYAGEAIANTVRAFGAVPVAVSPSETGDAMSKGTIDGALFPYEGAQSLQLGNEAKYSYEPGINSATFFLVMNPKSYDRLPPHLRKLIDETTGPAAAERIGGIIDAAEKDGRAYMAAKGVKVLPFPDKVQGEMKTAVQPLIKDALTKVDGRRMPGTAFYDAFRKGN